MRWPVIFAAYFEMIHTTKQSVKACENICDARFFFSRKAPLISDFKIKFERQNGVRTISLKLASLIVKFSAFLRLIKVEKRLTNLLRSKPAFKKNESALK